MGEENRSVKLNMMQLVIFVIDMLKFVFERNEELLMKNE